MFQQFGARLVAEETVQQPMLIEHHRDLDAGVIVQTTPQLPDAPAAQPQREELDANSYYEFFRH